MVAPRDSMLEDRPIDAGMAPKPAPELERGLEMGSGSTRSSPGAAEGCAGADVHISALILAPAGSPPGRALKRMESYQLAALHLLGFSQVSPRELPRVMGAIQQVLQQRSQQQHDDADLLAGDAAGGGFEPLSSSSHGSGPVAGALVARRQGGAAEAEDDRPPLRSLQQRRRQSLELVSPHWADKVSGLAIAATAAGVLRRRRGSRRRRLRRLLVRGAGLLLRVVALLFYILLALHFLRAYRKHRATLWELSFALSFCAFAVLTIATSAVSLLPHHLPAHHPASSTLLRVFHGLCVGLPVAAAVLCVMLARSTGTYRPSLAKGLLVLVLPSLVELTRAASFIPPPTPATAPQMRLQAQHHHDR